VSFPGVWVVFSAWANGKQHGQALVYTTDGRIVLLSEWKEGEIISKKKSSFLEWNNIKNGVPEAQQDPVIHSRWLFSSFSFAVL
jgi:hypothetical protein